METMGLIIVILEFTILIALIYFVIWPCVRQMLSLSHIFDTLKNLNKKYVSNVYSNIATGLLAAQIGTLSILIIQLSIALLGLEIAIPKNYTNVTLPEIVQNILAFILQLWLYAFFVHQAAELDPKTIKGE
jgi:hypothetical protein